jgi:ABC-type nitrate/sulfonate/bicarbonate transport system permease component
MGRGIFPLQRPNLAGWTVVLLVAVGAEASVRLFDLHDSVATPTDTVRALVDELRSGALAGELGTTLETYGQGFAIAIALGVGLGVVIGSSRTLIDATSVVLEFLRPIPGVALIPVAFLIFDVGISTHRFVIAYAATWPILVHTLYGVRGSDRLLHDVARTSGVTRLGRLVRVTLPAALPSIATGIRVSASIALLVCVTAEWVVGDAGLGVYMRQQQSALQLPELYAAVLLTALLGYAINVVLRATERGAVFWVGEERLAWR